MNDCEMRAVRQLRAELAHAQQQVKKQNVLLREIHSAQALYCRNKLLFAVRVNCLLFIFDGVVRLLLARKARF